MTGLGVLFAGMGAAPLTAAVGTLLDYGEGSGLLTASPPIAGGDLAPVDDLVFGGWDVYAESAADIAPLPTTLSRARRDAVVAQLAELRPMPAAFLEEYCSSSRGPNVKGSARKADLVEMLRQDVREFLRRSGSSRAVAFDCTSREVATPRSRAHESIGPFERGLGESDRAITPSQLYAWACVSEGVPFVGASSNGAVDFPALRELAQRRQTALAGSKLRAPAEVLAAAVEASLEALVPPVLRFSVSRRGEPDMAEREPTPGDGLVDPTLGPRGMLDVHSFRALGWARSAIRVELTVEIDRSAVSAAALIDLARLVDLAHRAGHAGHVGWLAHYFQRSADAANRRPSRDTLRALVDGVREARQALKEAGAAA